MIGPAFPPPRDPAAVPPPLAKLLTSEIAGASLMSVRSPVSGHPASGLTPGSLANLLIAAEQGDIVAYLELAEQMEEKDLHYLGVLGTRKRQVAQLPIRVEAASDAAEDQVAADLVREWLARDTLEAELFDILDAVGKGFSQTEIIWETGDRHWLPARLEWRDPRWFEFDRVSLRTPLLRGSGPPQPLPPYKFISHVHPAKSGLPIRGGLARPVAWGYLFKNFGLKDWVSFAEVYGFPFRIGRYDAGATEADIRTLWKAVSGISTDAAAVFSKSMEIDLVDGKANGSADLYERLCEYLDKQVSKAVLGQTATTDSEGGGLGGSGKEHNDVRGDIERADAKLVAATLNRDLVRPIVNLNFGPRTAYPRIFIGREEPEDLQALTTALGTLVPLGLRVEESVVRDKFGLPDPPAGARILTAPAAPENPAAERPQGAPAGTSPPATAARAFLDLLKFNDGAIAAASDPANRGSGGPGAESDDIDLGIAAVLAKDLGGAGPLIDAMVAELAGATSFVEARRLIDAMVGRLDDADLVEALTRAMFAAHAAADAGR